ncbi:MAG: sulfite exporter TauE/SafE family protein [Verrucomicrobia bacterium]|nr:sulfite exporter TauE/SafE family protein [Verrucomicrobiota bacterium]
MQYVIAGLIGLFGGVTSGLFGVGGGVVMVPAMMLLLKMDIKMAVGTSLAVIIPTALSGTIKHHAQGHVDWRAAASLIPMAILGGYLGALLVGHIPSEMLKRGFGAFLVLVGVKLLFFK